MVEQITTNYSTIIDMVQVSCTYLPIFGKVLSRPPKTPVHGNAFSVMIHVYMNVVKFHSNITDISVEVEHFSLLMNDVTLNLENVSVDMTQFSKHDGGSQEVIHANLNMLNSSNDRVKVSM
jgi:hypothetical protein